jgi:aspartate/methionine/tyrosine aminotransferase
VWVEVPPTAPFYLMTNIMSDLTLAKQDLGPDWIEAAVGEPHIVRANLFEMFDIESLYPKIIDYNQFEYTKPAGYDPLVKLLEEKHQAPVIISNGAKQAIGSLFFAIKKLGKKYIYMDTPWWSLFPPLIKMHGLEKTDFAYHNEDAQLIVYPNNPAGGYADHLKQDHLDYCRNKGIPTVHDAAYFSSIYMPELPKIGVPDVQVFTCSKMLGLSQLRVGYAVYHNMQLYKDAMSYMEHMTVGASILSQMFAYNILKEIQDNPDRTYCFEKRCYADLLSNRELIKKIPESILDPTNNDNVGMFLWTKCHNLEAFDKAKIKVAEGAGFGMPGYIRMNIALPKEKMIEVVDRLNQ